MKKVSLFLGAILLAFFITGCDSETLDDMTYAYPDSKDVVVTLENYNKLENGMTTEEVFAILGGKCSLTVESGEKGTELYAEAYGCNGNGKTGSNVSLQFIGDKLQTKAQLYLK